jgi:hypothetical protein
MKQQFSQFTHAHGCVHGSGRGTDTPTVIGSKTRLTPDKASAARDLRFSVSEPSPELEIRESKPRESLMQSFTISTKARFTPPHYFCSCTLFVGWTGLAQAYLDFCPLYHN